MLFLYFIIAVALFFYIRFFILNSLITKAARKATFSAALKAVYFIPLFLQGLVLIWLAVVHFFTICKHFLLLFNNWAYNGKPNYEPLYLLSYIAFGTILLSLHFILGKISLNKKTETVSILLKAAYVAAAYPLLQLLLLNGDLLQPFAPSTKNIFLYNNAWFILPAGLLYFFVLIFSFFYKRSLPLYRYLQAGVFISSTYIFFCMSIGIVLFLINTVLKAIG